MSNPGANEPGGAAYGWRRLLSGLGVLALLIVAGSAYSANLARQPRPGLPPTALEQMWGSPTPHLVDRVVDPLTTPPEGLVEEAPLGFQNLDDARPAYLRLLPKFSMLGDTRVPGYIGSAARSDVSATGSASLVVNVRGPLLCIPRELVVIESETDIKIAVYYGRPDSLSGNPPDHVAGCASEGAVTSSVLIPIELAGPIGDRMVQNLAGDPVPEVGIIE
ncbi:MAG: fumarate hydratase [Rhodoglobus sp.]